MGKFSTVIPTNIINTYKSTLTSVCLLRYHNDFVMFQFCEKRRGNLAINKMSKQYKRNILNW